MLKRIPLILDGNGRWRVDMPTYRMVTGSFQPVTANIIGADGVLAGADTAQAQALNPSVDVELPADTPLNPNGTFDADKLRAMYAKHPRYGQDTWIPPIPV